MAIITLVTEPPETVTVKVAAEPVALVPTNGTKDVPLKEEPVCVTFA